MSTPRGAPASPPPRPMMGGRGPFGGLGPPQKARHFKASARRLVGRLTGDRWRLGAVFASAILSAGLSVSGPRILGEATNVIFAGYLGSRLPADETRAQAVAKLRARGDDRQADMVVRMEAVPGRGVDLAALARILAGVMALYLGASLFAWLQGYLCNEIVQRAVRRLRAEVEDKLMRVPLAFFDGRPRGELLSRVTNDIDNVAQGL